jgi:predicted lysophospholipase L1 biosynthesis ABC-type transport system permease subunit
VNPAELKGGLTMAHRWSEPFATDVAGGRDFEPFLFGDRPISEAIDRARTWLMATGALALIIGIVAVAVPLIASVAVTIFIG